MKIWWNLLLMIGLMACRQEPAELTEMIDPGVSQELAQFRKSTYWDVKYNLSFVIPENKQEAVTGMAEIAWKQGRKEPLIVDFRADSSQIISVALNDKPVAYRFENEHIVISHAETWGGENKVKIAFRAADQSLNRRDEFLYTLLVPDRARTLFPCFDQPDIKALYSLTLDIPEDWTAVANGKIQEEEVNSYDTSGKTAFVYNRPKTIQQIIDDLSGETAKTNTETLSAASTTKKAIEGSWTSYTGNDPSMEYSSKYTLVFNSDGTVSCKGYKNNHSGNYEVESDGTIVCSFTKCIDSFPPNGPTEIQGYTAKFVLNSDGTLTSPTGSNGTTNWGKNTTWTKVQ